MKKKVSQQDSSLYPLTQDMIITFQYFYNS